MIRTTSHTASKSKNKWIKKNKKQTKTKKKRPPCLSQIFLCGCRVDECLLLGGRGHNSSRELTMSSTGRPSVGSAPPGAGEAGAVVSSCQRRPVIGARCTISPAH